MSRADAFAFVRALKAIGVNMTSADDARPQNIAERPRPLMRQLERQGFTVEAATPSAEILKRFDFEATTVFDVGVDTGTPLIYDAFPNAHFVLIDPVSESEDRVQHWKDKINFDFVHCALGAAAGTAEVKIPRRPNRVRASRASLAEFEDGNAAMFEDFETRDIKIRTLDDVAAGYKGPFGLKVDTEGFELEVIKGAGETLKQCSFVIAEVSVKRRFRGGYRFSELIGELGKNGFEPIDFLRPLRPDAVDCDVLFAPYESDRFDFGG
jgi:FkbM family methyltransferase